MRFALFKTFKKLHRNLGNMQLCKFHSSSLNTPPFNFEKLSEKSDFFQPISVLRVLQTSQQFCAVSPLIKAFGLVAPLSFILKSY